MFIVDLNEQTNIIQVKTNDENNSTIIAQGYFAVDEPDRTVLILFKYIKIAPDNYQEFDQFLSIVISYVGKFYQSFLCLRLPAIFDNRIDFNKLEFKNEIPDFMSVTTDHLKYYPDTNLSEQYELITDKQIILNYAEPLVKMMNREAFWSIKWNLEEISNRINSATNNVMIFDKINNLPCGFGRLFLLTTNDELFGYVSDIAVDSSHQSKGLGRIIVNYLVGISVSQDMKQRGINGTLCLRCALEGTGALSATKLYKRSGFEFVNDIGNRIAIFANQENYIKIFE
jgi:ribosomal protein S18 acetylase RimI-like enzyme